MNIEYIERTGTDNPFNGVDVRTNSNPSFGDVDNDGDLDALIGNMDGVINYFVTTSLTESDFVTI